MTWTLPGAILFLLGLLLLLGYFLARKVFPDRETPDREIDTLEGSPCEGCDVPGCGGFAKELIRGGTEAPPAPGTGIPPSCPADSARPAPSPAGKAVVRCLGARVPARYRYSGARSCRAASQMIVRPKSCTNACLGFGDCTSSCPRQAIRVEQSVARIEPDRCNGCGECLAACPVGLIELVQAETGLVLACLGLEGSPDPGACPDGCDGCGQCITACPEGALERTGTDLPGWVPERCTGCGLCVEACPRKVILLFVRGAIRKGPEGAGEQVGQGRATQAASRSPARGTSSRQ